MEGDWALGEGRDAAATERASRQLGLRVLRRTLLPRCQSSRCFFPASIQPRMDPLWNSLVVGGFYGGKPFLGNISMIGTNYTDETVATGALPWLSLIHI